MPKNLRKRQKNVENGPKFEDANKSTKLGINTADKPRSGASNRLMELILWKTWVKMPKKYQNVIQNSQTPFKGSLWRKRVKMPKNLRIRQRVVENRPKFEDANKYTKMGINIADALNKLMLVILW